MHGVYHYGTSTIKISFKCHCSSAFLYTSADWSQKKKNCNMKTELNVLSQHSREKSSISRFIQTKTGLFPPCKLHPLVRCIACCCASWSSYFALTEPHFACCMCLHQSDTPLEWGCFVSTFCDTPLHTAQLQAWQLLQWTGEEQILLQPHLLLG